MTKGRKGVILKKKILKKDLETSLSTENPRLMTPLSIRKRGIDPKKRTKRKRRNNPRGPNLRTKLRLSKQLTLRLVTKKFLRTPAPSSPLTTQMMLLR